MNVTPAPPVEASFRTALSIIFARARMVLIVTVCCAIGAGIIGKMLPAIYSGGFSILIKAPEIDLSLVGQDTDISFKPGQVTSFLVADEFQILTSYGLFETVAKAYLDMGYPFPREGYLRSAFPSWLPFRFFSSKDQAKPINAEVKQLAEFLKSKLMVTPVLKSDVIKVEMRHHDKQFLLRILNLLADQLFNYRKKVWFNEEAHGFFAEQSDKFLDQWSNTQDRMQVLKSKTHDINPAVEKQELEKNMVANITRLQEITSLLNESTKRLEYLQDLSPSEAVTFRIEEALENRLFWQLETDIGEAKSNQQELRKFHLKKSPVMQKMSKHLYGLYREYKELKKSFIKNTIRTLESERDTILKTNTQLSARLVDLAKLDQEMAVLEQQMNLLRSQHEQYRIKTSEIDVQNRLRSASHGAIRIISPPRVELQPVWPNKAWLMIGSTLLGLVLALLLTAIQWAIKDAITVPEEISRDLNLPVLASFPLIKRDQATESFRQQDV